MTTVRVALANLRQPTSVDDAVSLATAAVAEPGSYRPTTFGDPTNTFHEKAILCRAAENTCDFASVNYASEGSGTTSAIAAPDGGLLCYQPYGREGLLVADLDLEAATGLLAGRLLTSPL